MQSWEQPAIGRGMMVPYQALGGTGMPTAMDRLHEAEMDLKLMGLAMRTEEMRQKMQSGVLCVVVYVQMQTVPSTSFVACMCVCVRMYVCLYM